jgi:hypothetical protein
VDGAPLYDGHGIEQTAVPDGLDGIGVLSAYILARDIEVVDTGAITEPSLHLGADDGRDLLRRPRRTSTVAAACGLGRQIEHLDENGPHGSPIGLSGGRWLPVVGSIPLGVSVEQVVRPPVLS